MCVVLVFNCGAIVFCIGKRREGPISVARGLPDYHRILTTQTCEEISLRLLITTLDPPSVAKLA